MASAVSAVFAAAPPKARKQLLNLRKLILEAGAAQQVGAIEESLKWGEPAYRCKGGSTVRLAWSPKAPEQVAMHFICTTNLVDRFRALYPRAFKFVGNRSLVFGLDEAAPRPALRHCVGLALTYHRPGSTNAKS
jgi:hypothetical protein